MGEGGRDLHAGEDLTRADARPSAHSREGGAPANGPTGIPLCPSEPDVRISGKLGTCYGVGVGPGDPELLTLKAVRLLESCPVVAAPRTHRGNSLALDIVRQAVDLSGKQILELPFAMSRDAHARNQAHQAGVAAIAACLAQGKDVACITLGDVSVFSTFMYLADGLGARGFDVQVVPGVTSFSAVGARLGQSLTRMDEPLHVIPGAACAEDIDELLDMPGTKVLMKSCDALPQLIEALRDRGQLHRASLVANCGLPGELVCGDLSTFDPTQNPGYFTIVVVK